MSDRRKEELMKMLRMYNHLLNFNRPTIQNQYNLDTLIKLQMQLFEKIMKK